MASSVRGGGAFALGRVADIPTGPKGEGKGDGATGAGTSAGSKGGRGAAEERDGLEQQEVPLSHEQLRRADPSMRRGAEGGGVTINLQVGFIVGGAVSKTVSSLVDNIINPLVGLALGKVNLADKMTVIGNASIKWGAFISTIVDFVIIAAVVYFGIKALGLDKLDKKKE
jgi:large conductance mechanosensitive channel